MLLSLLGLGFASPYLSCGSLEKAWDGQECVGISSPGDDANELASLHNAVLENDGQVREDSELTLEDTAEFLEVGAAFACADGACDAGEVSAILQEKASSFLEDGFEPVEDLGALLEATVKEGRLSADQADFLELLVEDAASGRYSDTELQARIEEEVPTWENARAAREMLAVSRASYEYWGGAKVADTMTEEQFTTWQNQEGLWWEYEWEFETEEAMNLVSVPCEDGAEQGGTDWSELIYDLYK